MDTSKIIRVSLEFSLCLLLIAAGLMSFEWFFTGVTFGSNLWRPARLFAITMWFAVILFPVFVGWALNISLKARSLATTARLALIAWGFAAFWILDVYVVRWGW
jgi:hypothetical protein